MERPKKVGTRARRPRNLTLFRCPPKSGNWPHESPGSAVTRITSFSDGSSDNHPLTCNVQVGIWNVGTVGACQTEGRLTISASGAFTSVGWRCYGSADVCCGDGLFVSAHWTITPLHIVYQEDRPCLTRPLTKRRGFLKGSGLYSFPPCPQT